MSTTNVTTVAQDAGKAPARLYRDQRRSTALSSLAASPNGPAANTAEDFKSLSSLHPQPRFATSQNPEDIVASRYLQRLGNTLVRRASPDAVEAAPGSGRTSSFRMRRPGSRPSSGHTAIGASSAAPGQNARGMDGASATRRWRNQVSPGDASSPAATAAGAAAVSGYPPGAADAVGLQKTASGSVGPLSPLSPAAESVRRAGGRFGTSPDPRRNPKGERRGVAASRGSSADSASSCQVSGSPHHRRHHVAGSGTGDLSSPLHTPQHGGERAHADAGSGGVSPALENSTSGASRSAYSDVALRANTAITQAAALMASAVPALRSVRTAEERTALVVAQEHAKLMLLVGRRANLEADIESALELAELHQRDAQDSPPFPAASPSSAPKGAAAAAAASSPRMRDGSAGSKADAEAQLSVESGAVRRRVRQLLANLLGNGFLGSAGGATTLDSAHLNRLVQQMQQQLDVVESDLVERLEAEEDAADDLLTAQDERGCAAPPEETGRMRAPSTTSSVAAALQASSAQTLLQQRKRSLQMKQSQLRDITSNQEEMEWILESVDAELLTETPAGEDLAELGGAMEAELALQLQAVRAVGGSIDAQRRESILLASRTRRTSSQEKFAPVLLLSPNARHTGDDASAASTSLPSHVIAVSQPSMVPFSLTDSVGSDHDGDSVTKVFLGGKTPAQRPLGTGPTVAATQGLNLLGFMTDVLAQYELDVDATAERLRRRPLTAPSKGTSLGSRMLPYFAGATKSVGADGFDDGYDGSGVDGDDLGTDPLSGGAAEGHAQQGLNTHTGKRPESSAGRRHQFSADTTDRNRRVSASSGSLGMSSKGFAASIGSAGRDGAHQGTQLRDLRVGLLQDLHELRTLYDYMHLIDERRRELAGDGGEKGQDPYEAELERKLAEHRQQLEAAQRARDEAQRRKAEGVELDAFGMSRGTQPRLSNQRSSQHSATPQARTINSAGAAAEEDGAAVSPSGAPRPGATSAAATPLNTQFPAVGNVAAVAAEAEVETEVETELSRESVDGGKLFFIVVGISAAPRPPTGSGDGAKPKETTKKKKGGAAEGDNFVRYELRVERPYDPHAPIPPLPSVAGEAGVAEAAPAPLLAVVKVNARRLLNLKLTATDAASVANKDKMMVVTLALESVGAAPRALLSLTPVKRYKASSYAKAFEFSAEVVVKEAAEGEMGGAQAAADPREASAASMPFTFPTASGARSASASLDSKAVLAFPATAAAGGNNGGAARNSVQTTRGDAPVSSVTSTREGSLNKTGQPTPSRDGEGEEKSAAGAGSSTTKKNESSAPAGSAAGTTRAQRRKNAKNAAAAAAAGAGAGDGTAGTDAAAASVSLPLIDKERTSSGGGRGAEPRGSTSGLILPAAAAPTTPNGTPVPLPATPPLQDEERPVEEWGVPHPHPAMEAVEKNAVVLTVLWAEEEELPWLVQLADEYASPPQSAAEKPSSTGPSRVGSGQPQPPQTDSDPQAAAVEALLSAIPDRNTSSRPASGQSMGGSAAGRVPSASAIDGVASELLRQVMQEEAGDGVGISGEATSADPAGAQQVAERQASAKGGVSELHSIASPVEDADDQAASPSAADAEPNAVSVDGAKPPSSSTPLAKKPSTQMKLPTRPSNTAGGRPAEDAGRRHGALPSKAPEPPKRPVGTLPPPSLTITSSQSRPMRTDEAQKFSGGVFRLDVDAEATPESETPGERAAHAAATGSGSAPITGDPRLSSATGNTPALRAKQQQQQQQQHQVTSSSPPSGSAGESKGPASPPLTPEGVVPLPPPVMLTAATGGAKVHVLLPHEAVTTSLGPRVKSMATTTEESQASGNASTAVERRPSVSDSVTAPFRHRLSFANDAGDIAQEFSVLPKRGAAAEAAADVRTISHVQSFLQAVMNPSKAKAATGTAAGASFGGSLTSFTAGGSMRAASTGSGGGMGALRSEVDQLQEEARQLFMLDPVRYDAVVSELMQQAADELQREMGREQPPKKGSPGLAPSAATSGLPPVLGVSKGSESPAHGARPSPQLSVLNALHPEVFVEGTSGPDDRRVVPGVLSSPIPNPNAKGKTTGRRRSHSAGDAGSSSVSFVFEIAPGSPSAADALVNAQARFSSFASTDQPGQRRSIQPLGRQPDSVHSKLKSSTVVRRVSRADAVAEVERILYEQMKAKLLLRAIIEKMQALWQAKQRDTEEKNRGRVTKRMRRVVRMALTASWPLERQRVINLRKLIYLLDRRVGRVRGWLPHYSDTNVLTSAPATTMVRSLLSSRPPQTNTKTFVPISTWYREKDTTGLLNSSGFSGASGAGGADDTGGDACPRYLHYLPQRRMYHYVRLAKSRRLMPLQLVRADVHDSHSRHILLGYEKIPLEDENASTAGSSASAWPRRDLPAHLRRGQQRRGEYVPEKYSDMQTRGERERYRRRIQGAAAFQHASKMFSPHTRQEADLPFALH